MKPGILIRAVLNLSVRNDVGQPSQRISTMLKDDVAIVVSTINRYNHLDFYSIFIVTNNSAGWIDVFSPNIVTEIRPMEVQVL